jgi:acetyltransferase-like isoleucine patch superfamily enzyme
MSVVDRLVSMLMAGPLGARIKEAVAAEVAKEREASDQREALYRYLVHGDPSRLHIHPTAVVNNALFNLSSGHVTVERNAFFGHNVHVLTGTHDFTKLGRERQVAIPREGRDVVVEEGAWVASDALILGPCVIGAHAVVGAGSLVLKDVEPYTIVAGRPARLLRKIEPADADDGSG